MTKTPQERWYQACDEHRFLKRTIGNGSIYEKVFGERFEHWDTAKGGVLSFVVAGLRHGNILAFPRCGKESGSAASGSCDLGDNIHEATGLRGDGAFIFVHNQFQMDLDQLLRCFRLWKGLWKRVGETVSCNLSWELQPNLLLDHLRTSLAHAGGIE